MPDDGKTVVLQGGGAGAVLDAPFSEAAIAAHNERVKAFWAHYEPLINAITRAQAEAIVDLGMKQGKSMNQVAREMDGRLGFAIPGDKDVSIGMALYGRALVMLDLYDADFRPRPERLVVGRAGNAEIAYHSAEAQYEVSVGTRSERFPASHVPRFGPDVADLARAEEVASRLQADGPPSP